MFQQTHIITQKVSKKYMNKIRKEDIFFLPLVRRSETSENVVIASFHRLHFHFERLGTFFSTGAGLLET